MEGAIKKNVFAYIITIAIIFFNPFAVHAQRLGVNLSGFAVGVENFKKSEKRKYGLKVIHPYSFRLKTIQKSMGLLKYRKKSFFGQDQKRIFKNEVIKKLAPKIKRNFEQADSNQRVSFEIFSRSGKKFIKGDTFLTPQGLNWRFTILRWEKWDIDSFDVTGEPWVLVAQKDQAYKKWFWKKSKRVSRNITNWLIFKNISPISSNILPTLRPSISIQKKQSNHDDLKPSIKSRLLEVEKLWQEKIITEEEYRAKRKEILNDL